MKTGVNVIFGAGPLSVSVAEELLRQGKTVKAVTRSGKGKMPAAVEMVQGDITNPATVRQLAEGAEVVYMCAQPPYHRWTTEFEPMIASVIEGLAGTGTRLVFGDNLYMYGEVDSPIHEGLPYKATTRKGKVRARVAENLLEAHRTGRLTVAIGRGSDFFGPGVLGSAMGDRIFYPALAGKAAQGVGNLDMPHTYTYIKDFGRALVTLGENKQAWGQAWHVPSDPATSTEQFLKIMFNQLGMPYKASGMGKLMLQIAGLFIPAARESVEMMYEFTKPFVMDSRKFEQTFGWQATPLEEALHDTIAWYKAHPRSKAS